MAGNVHVQRDGKLHVGLPIAIYTVRLLAASLLYYYQRSKLARKILTLRLRQLRFPPRKIALVHGRH